MKKILLFANALDQSATEVLRRIKLNHNYEAIRINSDQKVDSFFLNESSYEFGFGNNVVRSDEVHAVWFRKGGFWFNNFFDEPSDFDCKSLSETLKNLLKMEEQRTKAFFQQQLMKAPRVLGNPLIGNPNKLIFMEYARSVGFKTPEFIISNNREHFASMPGNTFVAKGIAEGLYLWDKKDSHAGYFSYTEDFSPELLTELPTKIAPSILQKKIQKEVELRVFYIDGAIFAMAIFSQLDAQTATDFRKYNQDRPNRMVPYQLEPEIQDQLRALFAKVALNTGSVDLILDKNGDYYFLEINPFGQYEWVSWICNYDLDQHIADWLTGAH